VAKQSKLYDNPRSLKLAAMQGADDEDESDQDKDSKDRKEPTDAERAANKKLMDDVAKGKKLPVINLGKQGPKGDDEIER
jgi:hypothetical protein